MPDHPTEPPTTPAYPPPEPTRAASGPAVPATVGMPVGQPSDPWPHTGPTELAAPVPGGRPRRRWFWPLVLSGTGVLAVTAFLVVFLTAGGASGPLEFQAFDLERTIEVGDDQIAPTTALLDGDRIFLAADRPDGAVVFGTRVAGDGELWEATVPGMSVVTLMVAYGDVLVVSGEHADLEYDHYQLAVLDAASGQPRWQRDYLGSSQDWHFFAGRIVLADSDAQVLRGLDPGSGDEAWTVPVPEGGATINPVVTEEDLDGPSRAGRQYDLPRDGDRLVLIASDGSAQVIDTGTGETVGKPGANVADWDDPTYGYEDAFFVASADDGRLYRFDLADLSTPPEVLYSPATPDARITYLVACGTDRICLREETSETVRVVFVDTGGGEPVSVPMEAMPDLLLPVGEHLVVLTDAGTSAVFDPEGNLHETLPGYPVRINDANVLLARPDTSYGYGTMGVTGLPVGADRVELGQITDVTVTCAFDDELLVCPTSTGAGLWRFAAP